MTKRPTLVLSVGLRAVLSLTYSSQASPDAVIGPDAGQRAGDWSPFSAGDRMRTGVSGGGKAPRVWVVCPLLDEFDEEIVPGVLQTGRYPTNAKSRVLPWTTPKNGTINGADAASLWRDIR